MFNKDLQAAEEIELQVADILNLWWGSNLHKNPDPLKVDLIDDSISVEVKDDKLYTKTGNIAIEIRYKGKPSGISNSTSTHFCYVLGADCYIALTSDLRDYLKRIHGEYKIVKGGDNNWSELILLKKPQFLEVFTRVRGVLESSS